MKIVLKTKKRKEVLDLLFNSLREMDAAYMWQHLGRISALKTLFLALEKEAYEIAGEQKHKLLNSPCYQEKIMQAAISELDAGREISVEITKPCNESQTPSAYSLKKEGDLYSFSFSGTRGSLLADNNAMGGAYWVGRGVRYIREVWQVVEYSSSCPEWAWDKGLEEEAEERYYHSYATWLAECEPYIVNQNTLWGHTAGDFVCLSTPAGNMPHGVGVIGGRLTTGVAVVARVEMVCHTFGSKFMRLRVINDYYEQAEIIEITEANFDSHPLARWDDSDFELPQRSSFGAVEESAELVFCASCKDDRGVWTKQGTDAAKGKKQLQPNAARAVFVKA